MTAKTTNFMPLLAIMFTVSGCGVSYDAPRYMPSPSPAAPWVDLSKYVARRDSFVLAGVDQRDAVQTRSGLTITVETVNIPDIQSKIPSYCQEVRMPLCEREKEDATGRPSRGVNVSQVVSACAPLVDIAFIVRIKNDTTHSVDLSSAVMQLEDANGKTFEPLRDWGRCGARATAVQANKENPSAWPGAVRVLPKKQRETNAPFCFGNEQPSFPMSLLIYDVPVQTDVAGNITRRENFSFALPGEYVERYINVDTDASTAIWTDAKPKCPNDDVHNRRQEKHVAQNVADVAPQITVVETDVTSLPLGDGDATIAASNVVPQWVGRSVRVEMKDGTRIDGILNGIGGGLSLIVKTSNGTSIASMLDASRVELTDILKK